ARAEAIWRERAPGSLPPIDCGLCSSKEDPVAIVELDDRGLLVVDRHFARLYDRRTGLLYTTYPGVTMQCTPYITPPW
ncbi:MAG TPA: hypothetical protein VEJ18_09970, partial [Planctomycetota bacterium]|nr:hypothetical protein [Planctomycetota bacterium]